MVTGKIPWKISRIQQSGRVEAGVLCNEGNYNENSCGALSAVITLEPGESREMAFLAGMKEDNEAAEIIAHYADCEKHARWSLKN